MGSLVAVGLYAFAVGIFAPMQFIFSRRVPKVPVEELLVDTQQSRTGLILTVLAVAAVVVLAAVGGVRLG
jgi:hypothetical protein